MAPSRDELHARAQRLRDLHQSHRPLLLPNAWDAASARIFEDAGLEAIGTSSGAIARSLGYEDRQRAPAAEMLRALARIARAVTVPVTGDLEAGYDLEASELIGALLDTGAVGFNLEDSDHQQGGMVSVERHSHRLTALRAAADQAGVPVFINARVDVFIHSDEEGPAEIEAALQRCRSYLEAGADCVFPILAAKEGTITALVNGVSGPVNILHRPGGLGLERLGTLGVARISFGSGLFSHTLATLEALAHRIAADEDPYREANRS